MLTGAQIRAARALARWSLERLSEETGFSRNALQRLEQAEGIPNAKAHTLAGIEAAFRRAGIVAFDADDKGGSGVRFQK